MKIAITGTGYVGLVTGVCLAHKGHDVTCVDTDAAKIAVLSSGKCPIVENGLVDLMKKTKARLTFTTDYKSAYENSEVIFICVGTPERNDGYANLKYVCRAAEQIADSAAVDCVVVIKSTVPIGTNEKIEKLLTSRAKPGVDIQVASNPEFMAQGTAVRDMPASALLTGVFSYCL